MAEDSRSPLGVAVVTGQIAAFLPMPLNLLNYEASVLALLALRADVELRAASGHSALHLAAMCGHADITQAIVDVKALLEAETVYYGRPGHRPLSIACSEGHEKLVRLLVESRADMEARTCTGAAPLHVAAWNGHAEAAAALLAGKADVNVHTEDVFQRTPLALALMNGHSTTVGLLLGAKADVAHEESEDQELLTPANTVRSRRRRLFKKYTRKVPPRTSRCFKYPGSMMTYEKGIKR